MAAKTIETKILFLSLTVILCAEVGTRALVSEGMLPPMLTLGAARLAEAVLILFVVSIFDEGTSSIGLAPHQIVAGLKKGLIWSAVFGMLAFLGFVILYARGLNPVTLIKAPLPAHAQGVALFFLVGGLVAPVAEEVFFRGILYGFLRRWGVVSAIIGSTLVFVLAHAPSTGLPLIQAVGGLVFALAYEVEGNLTVPITIHSLGNMAIFALSLGFQLSS
ncbi:MAG: CPBP family intramembrane metalloprotease [Desulfobacterales bacterium]|nr:CPBP family intramembrane metalloprotease [Desulfobacterales bacterium]